MYGEQQTVFTVHSSARWSVACSHNAGELLFPSFLMICGLKRFPFSGGQHGAIVTAAAGAHGPAGLPEGARGREAAEKSEAYAKEGYGRKSAEALGMLEGDRPFQGIFPAKKIVGALDQAGLMSETAAGKELKEIEAQKGAGK